METPQPIFSVSEFIEVLNSQLKLLEVKVQGEVSELKVWSSGHVYFTLRDAQGNALLSCVIWKHLYHMFGIRLEVGMEIIVSGAANVYAPSGRLSFVTSSIELVGEGALKKAYEKLKQKLTAEGIFSPERKRELPAFPTKIGIITSRQGAVIHDFMNNISKHGFQITFINTKVEGLEALPELYRAIRTMKQQDVDLIVIMRGGGSLQSLAAFDAEILVREIVSSPVPIIAAIGHHQDIPLCALAADLMVSTPTAAANSVSEQWDDALFTLTNSYQTIFMQYKEILDDAYTTVQIRQVKIIEKFTTILAIFDYTKDHMSEYLSKVSNALRQHSEQISWYGQDIFKTMEDAIVSQQLAFDILQQERIHRAFTFSLKNVKERLALQEKITEINNPLRQLARGFSILHGKNGQLVKSIKDVTMGETLQATVSDGVITARTEKTVHKNYE